MTATRTVEDVNAYIAPAPFQLVAIGRGVTHYRQPWPEGLEGQVLEDALIAAGLPDTTRVIHSDTGALDIAVLLDDEGAHAATIDTVVDDVTGGP